MELGSEFNLNLSELSYRSENTISRLAGTGMENILLDSGRSAIRFLLNHISLEGDVLLPEYICESVIRCFPERSVCFYKITDQFTADVDDIRKKITSQTKAIFLMHYYGSLQPESIRDEIQALAKSKDIIVIEDATHSLFSEAHTIGDYVVASIRKWMPVPDGGVLLSPKRFDSSSLERHTDNTKAYGFILKDLFLRNKLDCNPVYRSIFAESEEKLNQQTTPDMISDLSVFIMKCINIPMLIEKRKRNYAYLKERLSTKGIVPAISMGDDCCPLAFPIRIPERDRFRKYLMDYRIYCAVHWPKDGIMEDRRPQAVKNAGELISLPIDQRYGEEDMNYMTDVIGKYGGELRF